MREYELMREHVRIGARILEPIEAYAGIIPVVLHHHEYYDGSGYPDNLSGEDIDLGARIFTVADHYDALISDRPYRDGLPRETVIGFIEEDSWYQVRSKGGGGLPGGDGARKREKRYRVSGRRQQYSFCWKIPYSPCSGTTGNFQFEVVLFFDGMYIEKIYSSVHAIGRRE